MSHHISEQSAQNVSSVGSVTKLPVAIGVSGAGHSFWEDFWATRQV